MRLTGIFLDAHFIVLSIERVRESIAFMASPLLTNDALPRQIVYLAWAFLFFGTLALADTITSLIGAQQPRINFILIFVLIGLGLIKRKAYWRDLALICCVIAALFYGIHLLTILFGLTPLPEDTFPRILTIVQSLLTVGISGWAIWVLTRKENQQLFEKRLR